MTAVSFLAELREQGFEIQARGEGIAVHHAQAWKVTAALLEELRARKGELLRLLSDASREPEPPLPAEPPGPPPGAVQEPYCHRYLEDVSHCEIHGSPRGEGFGGRLLNFGSVPKRRR